MLKCPHCGEENMEKELYCGKCHERLPSLAAIRSTLRSGMESMEKGDFRKALDRFTDVVRQNPGDMDGWFLRGAVQMRMGMGLDAWTDLVEVGLAQETDRCSHCRGTGKCPDCGGTGICIMCRGTKKCSYCGGNGTCPTCKGIHPEECLHCKYTGQCIRCRGSNECTYCNGYGNCSHCKGSGNCPACGGTRKGHKLLLYKVSEDLRELGNWFD